MINFLLAYENDENKIDFGVAQKNDGLVLLMTPWCSGYHYCTTSFIKAWISFCAGSNPARGVSDIRNGEDLWQWSRLEIRLRLSSVNHTEQFIIIIIIINDVSTRTFCSYKKDSDNTNRFLKHPNWVVQSPSLVKRHVQISSYAKHVPWYS